MIRCIAVDDEPLALAQVSKYIESIPVLELAGVCQSAQEASRMLQDMDIEAMFIDINMPDLSGLDFVRSLKDPPMVVFTTAYSEYAIDGYKVDAVDYLLKPFGKDEFQKTVEKLLRLHRLRTRPEDGKKDVDTLFLKSSYKNIRISTQEIIFVESMSEYLKIHLRAQPKPLIALLSLKKMEEYLPRDRFMRVHRSYLINTDCVKEVQKGKIMLEEGSILPIGDLYKDAFMEFLSRHSLEK